MRTSARIVLVALLLSIAAGVTVPTAANAAGSAGIQTTSAATGQADPSLSCGIFHKIAVVAKLGITFGLFHRYIYKPWKAGSFKKGAPHRTKTIVKAVAATLAGVLLARSAIKSMEKCGTGKKIAARLNDLKSKLGLLKNTGNGTADSAVGSLVGGMNGDVSKIKALESGL